MKLADIKRNYNAVFSLGNQCFVARKLALNGLRPYAGPIDWMISFSLPHVNLLLQNRFNGFMDLGSLDFDGYHAYGTKLRLKDKQYQISSAHDFPFPLNTPSYWPTYPEFRAKVNRRVQRFLEKSTTSNWVLYVRMGGTYEEAVQLQTVLSGLVTHHFHVLLVNDSPQYGVFECDWQLDKVCAIQVPLNGKENDELWSSIFSGVTCREA